MENIFLLIRCLCTVPLGTLRHFVCSAADSATAAAATTTAAPVSVVHLSSVARVAGQEPPLLSQYVGTPRLTLAMHPTARHFLLDDVPAWCCQQFDRVLIHYRSAPHPRA